MIFGEYYVKFGQIVLNIGWVICCVVVENYGDWLIQVGLYYYFVEVNLVLKFDCQQVVGYCLNILVGMVVCFEFGQKCEVELVVFVGYCVVFGFCGEVMGFLEVNDE